MEATSLCACGAPIPARSGPGRPRKFCVECRPAVVREPRKRPTHTHGCGECGAVIASVKVYCSQRCKDIAMRSKHGIPCDICGLPTWVKRATGLESARHRACVPPLEHGTSRGYASDGCRCPECTTWNRLEHRRYREKCRDEGRPVRSFGGSGHWIPERVKRAVFERDAWVCQLCGEPTDRDAAPNDDWFPSLDHIVPASKGGPHTFDNLRAAHRWCNSIRGAEDHHSDLFLEAS